MPKQNPISVLRITKIGSSQIDRCKEGTRKIAKRVVLYCYNIRSRIIN
jgi:hypothetical protein